MLVAHRIGDCPRCGHNVFGNVLISGNLLLRGCGRCTYSQEIPLRRLRKEVLYLDQSFFSGAFRARENRYVRLFERISRLASMQLMTVPRSSVHDSETRLWVDATHLRDFIKRASRGSRFEHSFRVERDQIFRGFRSWRANEPTGQLLQEEVLAPSAHEWDSYLHVDVQLPDGGVEEERELKRQSMENLIALFDEWRESESTFEEDVVGEVAGAKRKYLAQYGEAIQRAFEGDFDHIINGTVGVSIVQGMRLQLPREMGVLDQIRTCAAFFDSQAFAELPVQYVRSRAYAALKAQVKAGAFRNVARARTKLKGFYTDVEHVAQYAPYCNAVALDQPMAALMNYPGLELEKRYAVRVFSLNNLAEFHAWLDGVEEAMPAEHQIDLDLAYP
ncbi:hypothetical protein [Luteimonas sp. 3794]|uniref:hypothetical protein n=1 Tax=Luteimonas sp. 3794 TaxID=2817730 RepID=UPI0028566CCD|nr:hypothetical protein [Luteimonas sp. 3794]MDR6990209.1 ribosomal protein S27AE [Luteimonas sp. 3794]